MTKKYFKLFTLLILVLTLAGCSKGENKNLYSGTVEAEGYYITSEVSGKLLEVTAHEGQNIKVNDNVAKVDTKAYEIQKSQADGALKAAESRLKDINESNKNVYDAQDGLVMQSKASVSLAQLQIDKCSINSSVEGKVTEVFVHEGEMCTQGMNIAKVSGHNKYIKIYVEESKRSRVKIGQKLDIYDGSKKISKGTISYISSQSEFTPKNVETKDEKEKTVFEVKLTLDENESADEGMILDVELK